MSDIPSFKTRRNIRTSISIKSNRISFLYFIFILHSLCLCTATALTEQSVVTTQVFKKCGHTNKTSGDPGVILFYDPGVILHVYILRVHARCTPYVYYTCVICIRVILLSPGCTWVIYHIVVYVNFGHTVFYRIHMAYM